ncbi:hypothetical protein LQW54_007428 [Pestalotiopsis sp. IQ-011]
MEADPSAHWPWFQTLLDNYDSSKLYAPSWPDIQRRRAQVRLAQRAYRKRQTSALENLQQQVDEMGKLAASLVNSLSTMSKDLAMLRVFQMRPAAAVSFNSLVEDCASLCAISSSEAREEPRAAIEDLKTDWSSMLASCDWMVPRQPEFFAQQEKQRIQSPLGRKQKIDDGVSNEHRSEIPISSLLSVSRLTPTSSRHFGAVIHRPTSFAHRLHLLCLENGYHLLKNPKSDESRVLKAFGHTLATYSRTTITMRLERVLFGDPIPDEMEQGISNPEQISGIQSRLFPAPPTTASLTQNQWLEPLDVYDLLLKSNIPVETDSLLIKLSSTIPQAPKSKLSIDQSSSQNIAERAGGSGAESPKTRTFDVKYFLERE